MRILMTTILFLAATTFATTGFAGNEAETATDAADATTEETPAVNAAPSDTTDTKVATPASMDTTDADAVDARESATDAE